MSLCTKLSVGMYIAQHLIMPDKQGALSNHMTEERLYMLERIRVTTQALESTPAQAF